jgi:hypothetical protein
MRGVFKLVLSVVIAACPLQTLHAQDLAPRAYIITPIHWNAVTFTYSFTDGSSLFDLAIPITDAALTATSVLHTANLSYFHSLNFFGRSANITLTLPYGVGNFDGQFIDNERKLYRSGLLDLGIRFSVNLKGGPAMTVEEYKAWKQKTILGVSLRVVAPIGQYDPTKLINNGSNRWGFKPEFGYSGRWGHWVLDGYAGVWFYTTNSEYFSHNAFFPGTNTQSQAPITSVETHLSYDFKKMGLWVSFDGNFWYGGRTILNGVENQTTLLTNSRIGGTGAIPLGKHQSLKFSYSDEIYARFGGKSQIVSVAWQFHWLGRPN